MAEPLLEAEPAPVRRQFDDQDVSAVAEQRHSQSQCVMLRDQDVSKAPKHRQAQSLSQILYRAMF